jgi:hypothetical protein
MNTREGKDDIARNMMARATLLALVDLSPAPLVAWLVPSVLTLLTWGAFGCGLLLGKRSNSC